MTGAQEEYLNDFFVHIFNKILVLEEKALSNVGARDLSVKELHVLEAVNDLAREERSTMSSVAQALSIRVSSLTAAVNTLVRKGYLCREGDPGDRRIIRLLLTEKGRQANDLHSRFHRDMIHSIGEGLSETELGVLTQSLQYLDRFFNETAGTAGPDEKENK